MLEKALKLAALGMHVFPVTVEGDKAKSVKRPITPRGHLDATTDETIITDWFTTYPNAHVGVHAGESGIVALDIDTSEDGTTGYDTLYDMFIDAPETFTYETLSGGFHHIYTAPEGVKLNGQSNYRKYPHVDRRGGSSYIVWWTDEVPESREVFSPAPEWLCDPATEYTAASFEGNIREWFEILVDGAPNVLVRNAIENIPQDMSHSDMVAAQHHAVRLGAEGNPGVPVLLEALEHAWLNRDPKLHTTPQSAWEKKFHEALESGVKKYGDAIQAFKDLPEYDTSNLTVEVKRELHGEPVTENHQYYRLLEFVQAEESDDNKVTAIMWYAPATKDKSLEWGLQFVNKVVTEQREKMNQPGEAPPPTLPVKTEEKHTGLLTKEEREQVANADTFEAYYTKIAQEVGFANEKLTRTASWIVLSMTCGFKAFIPASEADTMPLNIWAIDLAYSGTGKTRALRFRDAVLKGVLGGDSESHTYLISATQPSPESTHQALIERDRLPALFSTDEASGFMETLSTRDYMAGINDLLSDAYDGKISPINKKSAKDLRGKSAVTSMSLHFHATPDRFLRHVDTDMFFSGFMARVNWSLGEEPVYDPDQFKLTQTTSFGEGHVDMPPLIAKLSGTLRALREAIPDGLPVLATDEALQRQEQAARAMRRGIVGHKNFRVLEPAITRLTYDTMRKVSALAALWRGSTQVELIDSLVGIDIVEFWYNNLFLVVEQISQSHFERMCSDIEAFIDVQKGSTATRRAIFNQFKNTVQKSSLEIDARLDMLLEAGRIVKEMGRGSVVKYRVNK